MAKEEKSGDEKAPAKKSKKKLITIVMVAVFALSAGAGGYLMLASGSAEEAPAPEPGSVLALDPVTINLADGHFLKVALALQATADAGAELDGSKALDLAIDHFSDKRMTDLSVSKGRTHAKDELKHKVGEAYEGEIMDIYFTEFVMQ